MSSPRVENGSPVCTLPPMICANHHEKVLPEEVPATEIVKPVQERPKDLDIIESPCAPLVKPYPMYPLTITWSPDPMIFEVKDDPVVQRLWVWNCSSRSIYIHCCEIWDETAYLGARWSCYPKTRFLLAPGIVAEMFVRASPKEVATVPCADARLQLAAALKRDHVIAYFAVPVNVKFLNHKPYGGEEG